MQSRIVSAPASTIEADLLVVPVSSTHFSAKTSGILAPIVEALGYDLFDEAAVEGFEGKKGQSFLLRGLTQIGSRRLLLLGVGDNENLSSGALRQVGVTAARRARKFRFENVALALPAELPEKLSAQIAAGHLLEGFERGTYRFDRYTTPRDDAFQGVVNLQIVLPGEQVIGEASANDDVLYKSRVLSKAITLARNLVNEPPAVMTPEQMAISAATIAREHGLENRSLNHAQLVERGFNLILAVGQGSDNLPALIHLVYRSANLAAGEKPARRIALVGKGITFDTGGYSIKNNMQIMHSDMAGGAAVLGAAQALAQIAPANLEIHFIVPTAENSINGVAFKPQDIIRGYGNKTVEILNTDAEGRLVLADAIAYAQEHDVDTIVDLATLTGSAVMALGDHTAALFSSCETLAENLLAAAKNSGEDMWRMPLIERLDKTIDTPVADMKNLGPREAGAITAALFLRRWVTVPHWAHLDIAGPAYMSSTDDFYAQGATGYGVATLVDFVCTLV